MEALGFSSLTEVVAQPPMRQSTKSVPIVRALLDNIVCLLSINILNGAEFLVSTEPNNTLFVLYVSSPSQANKIKANYCHFSLNPVELRLWKRPKSRLLPKGIDDDRGNFKQ